MNYIALQMLMADRAKYFGLIFAFAFSTFLLENQVSIFSGIMKRTGSQILDVTDADVWVMDPYTEYFEQTKALKDTDLTRVRGVQGVEFAVRLFKGNPTAKTAAGKFASTFTLGVDDSTMIGLPSRVLMGNKQDLKLANSLLIDKAGYQLLYPGEPLELGRRLELNDQEATIVGITDAEAPFVSFPVIHARYSEAVNFQGRERNQLSYVLVRAEEGVAAVEIARRIETETGLKARTTQEFAWDCVLYYLKNTGIPVNFGITIAVALIVGLAVSGQTFYMFTVENMKQFGALKAIGVTNRRLVAMVLLQALVAGALGYSLGTAMAAVFFELTAAQTATRGIVLLWEAAVGVGILMAVVVGVVATLSVRKVLVLEPASVFR
jgi:putative ABC transport system permease protein